MLPQAEELRRVLPVVEGLVSARALVSIDTYKATVAREAVARGAAIVNDVSALAYDRELATAVAESGAALIVMHNRGRSREMYREAAYTSVTSEIIDELRDTIAAAIAAGVRPESIVIDPGFGFAKHARHTYTALAELERFAALGRPILSGPSRKSFLNDALGPRQPADREWGTAAAVTASILFGAHIVRVHGVREMADVARVADRIRAAAASGAPGARAESREPDS
jgi:dihydropteroate synthase